MKTIALTKGKETIIDDEDYEFLSQYKWHVTNLGYARTERVIRGKRQRYMLHRLLMNAQKGQILDHINGNPLDNRRANLRFVTWQQNNWNAANHSRTGYKGVHWHIKGKKWNVKITENGKQKDLGLYDSKEEAARVYNREALRIQGQYARLNKV